MLKTLEKNLVGEILPGYWRQFAGWVIGLKNKYWHDPFVRSELNVVTLQSAFALSLFILSFVFFNYLYQFKLFSGLILLLSIFFIFIISKITLKPVKTSLTSQKRFISDIAHELRTPLSVIKTNGEVYLMDNTIDPHVRKMIESNIEELDRMSGIINNLLSFNNLVRPEKTKFRSVDVGIIIESVVNKLKSLAEKKELEITVKKVHPYVVCGNAAALEQIVTNLLKNSIDYTPKGGHIALRVGPDYVGNIVLHVEDDGVGITKNDLLHIFEPFYRAERSRNRALGSSGLGLTIVSELVKMHSGRITIKSSENKGTLAVVTLPYDKNIDPEKDPALSPLNEISVNFSHKK